MATSHGRIDGILLPDSMTSALVVTGSGVRLTFIEFVFVNNDSVPRGVEVQFIKISQTTGDQYRVIATQSSNLIPAGAKRTYTFRPMLNVGDFIEWQADVASQISGSAGYILEGG